MIKIASKNFKFGEVKFDGFQRIDVDDSDTILDDSGDIDDPGDHLDVWANIRLKYEGDPPESYRVLNQMIMDWVDDNEKKLKEEINPELISFLSGQYENIDISDLDADFDDYIWEDQVDYIPEVHEDTKEIKFVLELVLDVEQIEE